MNKPDYSKLTPKDAVRLFLKTYTREFVTPQGAVYKTHKPTSLINNGCDFIQSDWLLKLVKQQRQAAVAEAMAWRPIETAPKDDTELLLGQFDGTRFVCDGVADWSYWQHYEPAPTHWQPLPQPPQESQPGAGEGGPV